jgi:polysaccharide export outer membrane protein
MPLFRFSTVLALGWKLIVLSIVVLIGQSALAQRLPPTVGTLPQTYIVARTDRLRVEIYQEDDLSLIARVDAQGAVNLPLVGEVHVEGKTIVEAQRLIELAFVEGKFLRSPKVTVNVEEYAPREVNIHGMVRNPGRVPLPVESTFSIVDAVVKAGGLKDTAKGDAVTLQRTFPDGKSVRTEKIDIDGLIRGTASIDQWPLAKKLEPGDVINVPERRF